MSNVDTKKSEAGKSLAFGFASPIVGLTLALIVGMATQDLFNTVDAWMGVFIIGLIGASLVIGGHFSAIAIRDAAASHQGAPKAAAVLNLVALSVWSYTALIMSIAGGVGAISQLEVWPNDTNSLVSVRAMNAEDWTNRLIPALVIMLLLIAVVYLFVVLRSKGRKA